jgi:hypothetical protein
MHKLSQLINGEWREYSYSPAFRLKDNRIKGGIPIGEYPVFESLVRCMAEPLSLLYILHTPRGEAEPGRYQSPELTQSAIRTFTSRYKDFLYTDARFDIWAHSPSDSATVVLDRHNNFYAYGPLQQFANQLQSLGFKEGEIENVGEHQHHYHPELDSQATALIAEFSWFHSPLRPEDEQFFFKK